MDLPTQLPNPFSQAIVDDPWREPLRDVPAIHRQVFQTCCAAVEHVRNSGVIAGVLIQGQAGSGKTHLLSRLQAQLQSQLIDPELGHPRQAFISVRLVTNPRRIWRHVRQCLVDDLLRRMPDGWAQRAPAVALSAPDDLKQLEYLWRTDSASDGPVAGIPALVGIHARESRRRTCLAGGRPRGRAPSGPRPDARARTHGAADMSTAGPGLAPRRFADG